MDSKDQKEWGVLICTNEMKEERVRRGEGVKCRGIKGA